MVAPNTLIIMDIQIYFENHYGTRIAAVRPVCLPSQARETEQMPKLVKLRTGEPLRIFR